MGDAAFDAIDRGYGDWADSYDDLCDDYDACEQQPCYQTFLDLVAALHWQREQIHRYRKLQRNQVEICMEALKDRDSALEILELLGAKP